MVIRFDYIWSELIPIMSMSFSDKLRSMRTKADLSMDDLAELLNVSKQSIYKYEKSMLTPNPEVLTKLVQIFRTEIDDFFETSKRHRLERVCFRSSMEHAMVKLSEIEMEVIGEMELLQELEHLAKESVTF